MKDLTLSIAEALGFKDDVSVLRKYVKLVVDDFMTSNNKETKKANKTPTTSVSSSPIPNTRATGPRSCSDSIAPEEKSIA